MRFSRLDAVPTASSLENRIVAWVAATHGPGPNRIYYFKQRAMERNGDAVSEQQVGHGSIDDETFGRITTALFVPGDRPERFAKALAAGADAVIIDLEDAVAAAARDAARSAIREFASTASAQFLIRTNSVGSSDFAADIELVGALAKSTGLGGVVLPKVESAGEIERVADAAEGAPVLALVETVHGLRAATELAKAQATVRLGLGALDFAEDVGSTSSAVIDRARIELVFASRLAEIAPPIDSPTPNFKDPDAVEGIAAHAKSLGMRGMLAIHPAQLAPIRAAFTPSAEEVEWAQRVLALGDGVAQLDGEMVDAPVFARAQRILHDAR
jgi:citrate lyase subunit beta/citryl-CoA lyase